MGLFDFLDTFKPPQQRVLALLGTMYGVDVRGLTPITEAAEWLQEVPADDPRRRGVPPALLEGDYFLVNRQRDQGVVMRLTPDELEVRLPFPLHLTNGLELPDSHLLRAVPAWALAAIPKQRAQKVVERLFKQAAETFQEHHRVCRVCYKRIPPAGYPGHPSHGVLGPPAERVITCQECHDKAAAAEKAAEEAAKAARRQQQQQK